LPQNIKVLMDKLGLGIPNSWFTTVGLAVVWFGLMFAYSPLADRLASRWIHKPPTLRAFRSIQQSKGQLIIGIIIAWLLGGIVEEVIFRGLVLKSIAVALDAWLAQPIASVVAIGIAACGATLFHIYQGPRAMVIIAQLSILFGVLFVISGYNLWAVMICHGLYDTVAFVRFANKKSKYSNLEGNSGNHS
jgi:membrane protease YdiL (CAAX protease family)